MTTEAFAAVQQLRNSENDVQIIIPESLTWTSPISGPAIVTCIGGGGSGAAVYNADRVGAATGGAAGGTAKKKVTLVKDATYTITIGAGGAAVTESVDGNGDDGNDGGDTVFTDDASLTITGGGGNKGVSRTTAGTATGATGGTATGGDLNFTGGASGDATCETGFAVTGGGSVGIWSDGYKSGDATETDGTDSSTGGADVGVDGDNATNGASAPKGSYGLGEVVYKTGSANYSILSSVVPESIFCVRGLHGTSDGAGPGAGGENGPGGIFAGGGGQTGGNGGNGGNFGGGGGGSAKAAAATSGSGGDGVCVIEFRAERLYTS